MRKQALPVLVAATMVACGGAPPEPKEPVAVMVPEPTVVIAVPEPEPPAPPKRSSHALLHLPKSCGAVLRIDVRALLETPVVQHRLLPMGQALLISQVPLIEDLKVAAMLERAGVDLQRDIDEVVVCASGIGEESQMGVAVGGGIQRRELFAELQSASFASSSRIDDIDALAAPGGDAFAARAPDGVLLFATHGDMLADMYPAAGSHQQRLPAAPIASSATGEQLVELLDEVLPAHRDEVVEVSLGLDLGKGEAALTFAMRSDAAATALKTEIDAALDEIRNGQGSSPVLATLVGSLLDGLVVERDERDVHATLTIPPERLDQLLVVASMALLHNP